ncbi:MAG: lysophospholipid acyltransferase family protein [Smithella sp.]
MFGLIKDLALLVYWYPLRFCIRFIPLLWIYRLGKIGGSLLFLISKQKRLILSDELKQVFPDLNAKSINIIVKDSFANYCMSELEVLLYPEINKEYISKHISMEGMEHLEKALSHGSGVLLLQAHFGAFQMVLPILGHCGYVINQISASASLWKSHATSAIQKIALDKKAQYENRLPIKHFPVGNIPRPLFMALRRNEIVGITSDGGAARKTVEVRFLGRTANFPQGVADLALKTGAVIVPAFIITGKNLFHRLVFHPPLEKKNHSDPSAEAAAIMQDFADILSDYVRRYPNHYGYTLCLRRVMAATDEHPLFADYESNAR